MTRAEAYEGRREAAGTSAQLEWPKVPNHPCPLEKPDYSRSISALHGQVAEAGRSYTHWKSLDVYPIGIHGTTSQPEMAVCRKVISNLGESLPGLDNWRLTDTTARGFFRVFSKKVDTTPVEEHPYTPYIRDVYRLLEERIPMDYRPLTMDELRVQANKQGAKGVTDVHKNVAAFLADPNAEDMIREIEDSILANKPIHAVWSTMGKREKKKFSGALGGSRMIAYLPIGMRLVEMKYLQPMMKATKPDVNPTGVGGVGLHDFGERLRRLWKGRALSDDIAGWDTRVSVDMLQNEHLFIKTKMERSNSDRRDVAIVKGLFNIYAHPLILVPFESEYTRAELLQGRGQRMSGSAPTYAMNTISRLAVLITQLGVCMEKMPEEIINLVWAGEINAMISGDDCTLLADENVVRLASTSYDVLNSMGMVRKDIPLLTPTPILKTPNEVSFCSHNYEAITYHDAHTKKTIIRWMPTRSVDEIVAKATLWMGYYGDPDSEIAWLSAQGNTLLTCYHHLRLPRLLGFAYKAVAPENLILTDEGAFWRKTPWIKPGKLIDIINEVLFGESTMYPVVDFRVRELRHLGYLGQRAEREAYFTLTDTNMKTYRRWKIKFISRVAMLSSLHNGDSDYLLSHNSFAIM